MVKKYRILVRNRFNEVSVFDGVYDSEIEAIEEIKPHLLGEKYRFKAAWTAPVEQEYVIYHGEDYFQGDGFEWTGWLSCAERFPTEKKAWEKVKEITADWAFPETVGVEEVDNLIWDQEVDTLTSELNQIDSADVEAIDARMNLWFKSVQV